MRQPSDRFKQVGKDVDRIMNKLELIGSGEDNDTVMLTCAAFTGMLLGTIRQMDERRAAWSVVCHIMTKTGRVKFPKEKKAQLYSISGGKASHEKPNRS